MTGKIFNVVKLIIGIALVTVTSFIIVVETYSAFTGYNSIFYKIMVIGFDAINFVFTLIGINLIRSFFVVKNKHKEETLLIDFRQKQREFLDNQDFKISKTYNTYPIFIIDDEHDWFTAVYDNSMPSLYKYRDILEFNIIFKVISLISGGSNSNMLKDLTK